MKEEFISFLKEYNYKKTKSYKKNGKYIGSFLDKKQITTREEWNRLFEELYNILENNLI